jgi:hypothetical protein
MKSYIFLMALMFSVQLSVKAQKSKPHQTQPKEDIHVNREFDPNGNLIKFDSLYSYSWSGDTLLFDSIHPWNFNDPFKNKFNFPPDSSFFDLPFFQGFDQNAFGPLSHQQDSIINQFRLHHQFNFKNDSIGLNSFDMNDFVNQFSENRNDSISINSPINNQLNFSPNSMNDMIEMFEKQMKELEEQQQKVFSK